MANSSHDQPLSLLGAQLQLLPPIAEEPKQTSATGHRGCRSDLVLLGRTLILASVGLGMELAKLAGDGLRLPPSPGPPSSVTLLPFYDCNSTKLLLPSDMEDAPLDEQPSPPESLPQWSSLVGMVMEGFKEDPYQPFTPTHMSATQALRQAYQQRPSEGS